MAYGYARGRSSELDHEDVYAGPRRPSRFDREGRAERDSFEEARNRPRRRRDAREFEPDRPDEGQYGLAYEDQQAEAYRPERGRRPERRGPRAELVQEERVTRILDDALDAMQHTLRLNEDRTAEAIQNLARRLDDRRQDNRVREMQSGIERDFARRAHDEDVDPRDAEPVRRRRRDRDVEEQPAPAAEPADRGLERQIAALGERIEGLVKHVAAPPAPQPRQDTAPIERLRAEVARLDAAQSAAQAAPQPQNDQLIEALRALDAKVGRIASPPDGGLSAVAGHLHSLSDRLDAIAEKVSTLRVSGPRDLRSHKAVDSALGELKRLIQQSAAPAEDRGVSTALQALERRLESLVRTQPALVQTFDRVQAIEKKLDSMQRTTPDIAELLGRLDRPQPALVETYDRVQAIERKLDSMQRTPPDLGALLDRLDRPQPALAQTFDRVQAIEKKLDSMQRTPPDFGALFDRLDRPQPALVATYDRVQAIEKKLDSIQRTPPELAERLDRLDRLEALERKLDVMQGAPIDIAERLDEIRAALVGRPQDVHHAAGVEAALGALAARVERLHQDKSEQEALHRLQAEVQAISQKIDLAATSVIPGDSDAIALDRIRNIETKLDMLQEAPGDLARRLDQIQHMMQTAAAQSGVPQGFETLLRNLALRLESIQSGPVDDGTLDRLHNDIRQISQKLESHPAAQQMQGFADVGGLERSMSELFGQLQELRGEIGATAEEAARQAASQVIHQGQGAGPPDEGVRRQLTEIHVAQQEAERRSNETLGAVHETLTRVVDRLVHLEQDVKVRATPPVAAPAAAALSQPGPMIAEPLPPLGAPAAPDRPLARMPGIADGPPMSIAALRSQQLGVSTPVAAEPPAKPGIGQMFAAARDAVSGLKRGKDKAAEPAEPAIPETKAQARPSFGSAPDLSLDMPLEPGSGRPRPGQRDMMGEGKDPKAQFLAAARRAAQAAADQSAEALAQNAPQGKGSRKPVSARKSLSKKQIILLGLAALVVAVGASVQVLQSPPKVEPQGDKLSNLDRIFGKTAPSEQVADARTQQPTAQQTAAALPAPATSAPATPPRQIVPVDGTAQARQEERIANAPPRAAQPSGAFMPSDPATVGAISSDPVKVPDAAAQRQPLPAATNDPLMRFEGIAGAEKLKAAARAGDTAAFIELGNRHLEGKGAPRDARTAALWFERAAEAGSAPAQFRLGTMYREGRGLDRNPKLAFRHFQSAAEAGNARAMYNAAVLLAEGVNGSPDYAAAGEWFKKAAEFGIRDSQYNLAILYARGLGVPQDLVASYAWFSAAAASGDEDAVKKRDEVAARLSPEKLTQAKAAAAAWKTKTPDPAANEISQPRGGWDSAATPGAKQVPSAALNSGRAKAN